MVEIDEKQILNLEIRKGLIQAEENFKKYNNYYSSENDMYSDIVWQIIIAVMYYWEYNNVIDIITLNNKNIDTNLLNILLSLIKKETYTLGLRILRKENLLYVYIDNVINKDSYYVDEENAKKITESILYKEQINRKN